MHVAVTCSPEGKLETMRVGTKALQRIDGQPYEQVIARNLPNKRAAIVLTNDVATPYRCIGGFIYTLQRLGYRHVGFTSGQPME